MNVEELIAKLKRCPKKAVVCWDSNKTNYWFGEEIEVTKMTKREVLDEFFDEDGNAEDCIPNNMRTLVRLL